MNEMKDYYEKALIEMEKTERLRILVSYLRYSAIAEEMGEKDIMPYSKWKSVAPELMRKADALMRKADALSKLFKI